MGRDFSKIDRFYSAGFRPFDLDEDLHFVWKVQQTCFNITRANHIDTLRIGHTSFPIRVAQHVHHSPRNNQIDSFLDFLASLPLTLPPLVVPSPPENAISESRVLIFSRLPRLDLAGDSTPASTMSTFRNSRVVGGRNVEFGKGNVRLVCSPVRHAYTDRILAFHFLPVSSFPEPKAAYSFTNVYTRRRIRAHKCVFSRLAVLCAYCRRARVRWNARRQSTFARVCEVLIN